MGRMVIMDNKVSLRIEMLSIMAVLGACLDGLTTTYALTYLTVDVQEINPLMASLIEATNVPVAMCIKISIAATLIMWTQHIAMYGHKHNWMNRGLWLQRTTPEKARRNAYRMLWVFAAIHALVTINNVIVIVRYA